MAILTGILPVTGCGPQQPAATQTVPPVQTTPAPTQPADIDASLVDYVTQTWIAIEIPFVSSVFYQHPLEDAVMDVKFIAPDGAVLVMPAFWDGEASWKVRFAPTMYGIWNYETICSDTANSGLHGIKGTLGSNAYKGDLEIYRHGFITVSENKRYFTYADGTPFFYLGDTHWSMPFERFEGSDVSGIDSQFKYIVDKRIEQGFNVYQSEPIQTANKQGDEIYNLRSFSDKALDGFHNMDNKFLYLAEKGMVHANAQLFFAGELANAANLKIYTPAYLEKLTRYWVARYGAYPVMWTTAQEVDNDFHFGRGHQTVFTAETNPWKAVTAALHKYDPYTHPITAHMELTSMDADWGTNATTSAFKYIEGHNWYAAQWKPTNNKGQLDFAGPEDLWNSDVTKPTVNYEGKYDHFWTDTFGARMQGWTAFLNGMCGHGYGAAGIWLIINDYEAKDYAGAYDLQQDTTDPLTGTIVKKEEKRMTWYEGLQLPAATELGTHMRNFFQSMEWWKLEPCFDDPQAEHVGIFSAWYSAATIGSQTYVVYFYNPTTLTGNITGLEADQTYTARWYNPRTGEYTDISTSVSGSGAKSLWKIPEKPDTEDWILYVTINP